MYKMKSQIYYIFMQNVVYFHMNIFLKIQEAFVAQPARA